MAKIAPVTNPIIDCEKPSDLIRMAVSDLTKIEKSPKYRVNMATWHQPTGATGKKPQCEVCFAGATFARQCNVATDVNFHDFTDALPRKAERTMTMRMSALNSIRTGYVRCFAEQFYGSARKIPAALRVFLATAFPATDHPYDPEIQIAQYKPNSQKSREAFKAEMRAIAAKFAKAGF